MPVSRIATLTPLPVNPSLAALGWVGWLARILATPVGMPSAKRWTLPFGTTDRIVGSRRSWAAARAVPWKTKPRSAWL